MAFRIHDSVTRGEIDNRTRGVVRGRIWVEGRADPVTLELQGNAWPDLAGCRLTFVNPLPRVPHPGLDSLHPLQRGVIGDLTASRKVRVFDVPLAEALAMIRRKEKPPEHLANSLYLEWFSEANGRVVIESADYQLDMSAPVWRMTPEENIERAQQAAAAMDDFMRRLTGAVEAEHRGQQDPEADGDEHDCGKFMRESDARADGSNQPGDGHRAPGTPHRPLNMDTAKPGTTRIEPAAESDLPALASLAAVIWRACYPGIISSAQIDYMLARMYAVETLREEIRHGGVRYDRLLVAGQFVGFSAYGPAAQPGVFKLHKLYLLPEYQGRGLGSLLLRHGEAEIRRRGGRRLTLNVNKNNTRAIAAYQRNGFSIANSVVTDIGGGFVMDDYVMEKELGEAGGEGRVDRG